MALSFVSDCCLFRKLVSFILRTTQHFARGEFYRHGGVSRPYLAYALAWGPGCLGASHDRSASRFAICPRGVPGVDGAVGEHGEHEQLSFPRFHTNRSAPWKSAPYVITLLNQTLAYTVDLRSHVKQACWIVKGTDVLSLQAFFALATELDAYTDLGAARIAADGVARGTARMSSPVSALLEYPEDLWRALPNRAQRSAVLHYAKVHGRYHDARCGRRGYEHGGSRPHFTWDRDAAGGTDGGTSPVRDAWNEALLQKSKMGI